LKVAWSFSKI